MAHFWNSLRPNIILFGFYVNVVLLSVKGYPANCSCDFLSYCNYKIILEKLFLLFEGKLTVPWTQFGVPFVYLLVFSAAFDRFSYYKSL